MAELQQWAFRPRPLSRGNSWTPPSLPNLRWPWTLLGFSARYNIRLTLITRIELSIIYLNTGSCEFHSLDLSEFLVLLHIDDLDRVGPNEARTGKHLGADGADPANRGVPGPLVLRGFALSVCSGALSLRVHREPRALLVEAPHLNVGFLLELVDHLGRDTPQSIVVFYSIPRCRLDWSVSL